MLTGLGAENPYPGVMTFEEAQDPDACGGGYYAGTKGYQFTHIPLKVRGTEDDWTCREVVRCKPGWVLDDNPVDGSSPYIVTDTQMIYRCKKEAPSRLLLLIAAGLFGLYSLMD